MDEQMIRSSWNSDIEDNILGSHANYIPTGFLGDSPRYYSYDSDETVLSQLSPELAANSEILAGNTQADQEQVIEISDDECSDAGSSDYIFENSPNSQSLLPLPDPNESQIFYSKLIPETKPVDNHNEDNPIRGKRKIFKEGTTLVGARSSQRKKRSRCPPNNYSNSLYEPVCFEVKADQSQRKKKDEKPPPPTEYESHRLQMEELNIAEAKLSSVKTLISLRRRDQAETVLKKEVAERLRKIQQKIKSSNEGGTQSDHSELNDPRNQLLQVRQTRLQQLVESVETLKTEISSVKTSQFMTNDASYRKSLYPVIEKTSTVKIVVKTSYKRTVTRTTTNRRGRGRRKSTARDRYPPLNFITHSHDQVNEDATTKRTNVPPENKTYNNKKADSPPSKLHYDSSPPVFQADEPADQVVVDSCSDNGDFDDDSDCVPDKYPFLDNNNNSNDETLNNRQQVDASFSSGNTNNKELPSFNNFEHMMNPAKGNSSPVIIVEDSCPMYSSPTKADTFSDILSQSNPRNNVNFPYGPTVKRDEPFSSTNYTPRLQHNKCTTPVTVVEDSCPPRSSPTQKADTFTYIFPRSNVNSSCGHNDAQLPDINCLVREGLIQKGNWMLRFKHKMTEYKASVTGNGKVISAHFDLFDNVERWLTSIVPFNFSRMKAYELVTYGEKPLIEICRNINLATPQSTENIHFSQSMEHVDKELTFLDKLKSYRFRVLRAKDFLKASNKFIRDFDKLETQFLSDEEFSD